LYKNSFKNLVYSPHKSDDFVDIVFAGVGHDRYICLEYCTNSILTMYINYIALLADRTIFIFIEKYTDLNFYYKRTKKS